jgi:signal transduction histidine kinase
MSEVKSPEASTYAQLLSLAVHEFRTPVSVVGGYLRMLQSGVAGALSDPQRKMIGEAEKSCARIVALIGELSDIGKLDGRTLTLNEGTVDLFQLINDVAGEIHEAADREVHLAVRGAATGARIRGDRLRLAGAFSVLLRAILREQPSATTVVAEKRLERTPDGDRATIVVAREDSVQQTHDADPAPFDELRGGLGLGLPLARRVIEHYRGQVWTPAAGERDRQGFVVSMPVTSSDRE